MLDGMYAEWGRVLAPWLWPAVFAMIAGLAIGFRLVAWSGKRRFARRNFAGVEQFDSYGQSVGHRMLESLVDLAAMPFLFVGMCGFVVVLGAVVFGHYGSSPMAATASGESVAVDVSQARAVLKESDPDTYKALVDSKHPKTTVDGTNVSYEWEYVDKQSRASAQVKRIRITLDSSGRIVGVTNP